MSCVTFCRALNEQYARLVLKCKSGTAVNVIEVMLKMTINVFNMKCSVCSIVTVNSVWIFHLLLTSTQKQSSCKKRCGPCKKTTAWKKLWNQRWRPRSGCDGRIMAKFLMTTIQANLCCLLQASLGIGTKFTWSVVIKNFAIILPSQPLLGCHLWFHNFFHAVVFCMGRTFFTAWLFLCRLLLFVF